MKNDANVARVFILHKMTGSVKAWFSKITPEQQKELMEGAANGSTYLWHLVDAIYFEFLGRDKLRHSQEVNAIEELQAKWHLDNMLLCDVLFSKLCLGI